MTRMLKHLLIPVLLIMSLASALSAAERPPSVVIILTDDQGYGDLGCYGATDLATPHIDSLARDGALFTDAYASPVCTPTRASLLTGSHPLRIDMTRVLWTQRDRKGLNPSEVTIAELLQAHGYRTAALGKWHVGGVPELQPPVHGFDDWFGLPAGHNHGRVGYYQRLQYPERRHPPAFHPLQLVDGTEVVELEPAPDTLTERFTDRAIEVMRTTPEDQPFFIYLAHPMPHFPVVAGRAFIGSSERGTLYGDAVQEIDHHVGRLLATLTELGRDQDTLVVFLSDNGPTEGYGPHETGDAGGLRGMKGSTWEGGVRVPMVMRWPQQIPPGQLIREPVTVMDLFPTAAAMAGAALPETPIDGRNLLPLLRRDQGWVGHEAILHVRGNRAEAIRVGDWKLREVTTKQDDDSTITETWLFDLSTDPGEHFNLAARHPERVAELRAQLQAKAAELRAAQRPSMRIPKPE